MISILTQHNDFFCHNRAANMSYVNIYWMCRIRRSAYRPSPIFLHCFVYGESIKCYTYNGTLPILFAPYRADRFLLCPYVSVSHWHENPVQAGVVCMIIHATAHTISTGWIHAVKSWRISDLLRKPPDSKYVWLVNITVTSATSVSRGRKGAILLAIACSLMLHSC